MRKTKFIVLLTIGSLLTFGLSGCKDYDDDISKLNERVDKVSNDLKVLQDWKTNFPAGSVATDLKFADDANGGFTVTWSNGSTYKYTPGATDAKGARWEANGDGVETLWIGDFNTGIEKDAGGGGGGGAIEGDYVVGEQDDANKVYKFTYYTNGKENPAKSFTIPFANAASTGGITSIVFLPQVTLDGRPAIYAPAISVDTTGISKSAIGTDDLRDTIQGSVTLKFRLNPASAGKGSLSKVEIFSSTLTELRAAVAGGENSTKIDLEKNVVVSPDGIMTITLNSLADVRLDSAYSITNAPAAKDGNNKPYLAVVVNDMVVSTYVPVVTEVIPYEQIFIGESRTPRGYVRYGIEHKANYNYAGDPKTNTMGKDIAYKTTADADGPANRWIDHVFPLDYKRESHNKGEGTVMLEPSLFRVKPTTFKKVPVEGFNNVKWIYRLASAGDKVIGRYNTGGSNDGFVNRSTDAFTLVQENGKTNLEVDEVTGARVYVRAANNDSILRFQTKDSVRVRIVADFSAYIGWNKEKHTAKNASERRKYLAVNFRDSTDAERVAASAPGGLTSINTDIKMVGWAAISDPYFGNPLVKVVAELPIQPEQTYTWVQGGDSIIGGRAYTGAGHAAAVARGFIDSTLYIALRDGAGPAKLSGSMAINAGGTTAADYIGGHRVVTLQDKNGDYLSDTAKIGFGHYAGGSRDSLRVHIGATIGKGPYTVKWAVERPDLPGVKYVASFKITLQNPTIKVQPIAEYWDGDTQISYGELFDPTTAASPTSRSVENPWLMRAYLNRALDLGNAIVDYSATDTQSPTADTFLIVSKHKDAWGWGNPRSQLIGRHDIITDSRKDLDTKRGIVGWGKSSIVNAGAGADAPNSGGDHDGKYYNQNSDGVGGLSDSIMGFRAGADREVYDYAASAWVSHADTLGIASDTVANYFMNNDPKLEHPIKTAIVALLATERYRNQQYVIPGYAIQAVGEFPIEIVGITNKDKDIDAGMTTYKVQFRNPLTFAKKANVPLYTGNTDKHDVFTVDPDATTGYLVSTSVPGVTLAPSTTSEPYKSSQFITSFMRPIADGYSEMVQWGQNRANDNLWPLTVNWADVSVPADFSLNNKVFSVQYKTRWGETPRVPGGVQLNVTNP